MKRHGILNSNISRVLSAMGHTDRIAIADCGLPVPEGTERIDLAVTFGNPRFMDVLKAVSNDMKIEAVVLAEEIKEQNPQILEEIQELFASFETGFKPEKVEFVSHTRFKEMTKECRAVIRTGETKPYANIILQSGCIFKSRIYLEENNMKIEMKGINKSFGQNQVLRDAGFVLDDGEVHALMGENGAGKSTLMKILTGVYTRDGGTVIVDGKEVTYKNPQEAEKAGIVFIQQELNVLFDLTVEENLFLGKEIKKGFGICDRKAMRAKAEEILKRLGVSIPTDKVMSGLSVGQQQMIEICKALMVDAKVIIMDEPTAALTQSETEVLFEVMQSLRKKGVSIVYISHRMEEIFELCDRISVLRDGTYIGTKKIPETNMNEIVKMMIGREIGERYPKRDCAIGSEVFRVEELTKEGVFHDVNFSVKAGEVLGVSGLMGAGRTEIMQAIFGNLSYDRGSIFIGGKQAVIKNPLQAIEHGIGFITEDRKTEGLLLEESIEKNVSLTNLERISGKGRVVISREKERGLVTKAIEELHIRCFGPGHECVNLSGGNQQKVVFAKWIYTEPRILILDEPTRGVDIGAKKEIYSIINQLAEKGVAIIMVSSELPEVLGMSDRIMVVREGMVRGIINQGEADQEKIMTLATGGTL